MSMHVNFGEGSLRKLTLLHGFRTTHRRFKGLIGVPCPDALPARHSQERLAAVLTDSDLHFDVGIGPDLSISIYT